MESIVDTQDQPVYQNTTAEMGDPIVSSDERTLFESTVPIYSMNDICTVEGLMDKAIDDTLAVMSQDDGHNRENAMLAQSEETLRTCLALLFAPAMRRIKSYLIVSKAPEADQCENHRTSEDVDCLKQQVKQLQTELLNMREQESEAIESLADRIEMKEMEALDLVESELKPQLKDICEAGKLGVDEIKSQLQLENVNGSIENVLKLVSQVRTESHDLYAKLQNLEKVLSILDSSKAVPNLRRPLRLIAVAEENANDNSRNIPTKEKKCSVTQAAKQQNENATHRNKRARHASDENPEPVSPGRVLRRRLLQKIDKL